MEGFISHSLGSTDMAEVRKRKWDQESEDPAAGGVKQPKVEEGGSGSPVKVEDGAAAAAAAAPPSTGNAAADAAMAAAARIAAQVSLELVLIVLPGSR